VQTEQEWAVKLKRADDDCKKQLAQKDQDARDLKSAHAAALAAKDEDAKRAAQAAKEREDKALKALQGQHEAALAAAAEERKRALAAAEVCSADPVLFLCSQPAL
jgi:hypothetical protein